MIGMSRLTNRRLTPGAIVVLLAFAPTPLWAQCVGSTHNGSTATQADSIAVTASLMASDCQPQTLPANELLLNAPPTVRAFSPSAFLAASHAAADGPPGKEKTRSLHSDWGNSALTLIGYHFKSTSLEVHNSNLIAGYDRSAFWGGALNYDMAIGQHDAIGFGFDSSIGKQRSAFTPQVAHRYSSQSLGVMINWEHDHSFGLSAAMRNNHISAVTAPWERQAARAAGSPLEASGLHLTASFFPFANQNGGERGDRLSLSLDAYHQRLSPQDAAVFSANGSRQGNGAMIAAKFKF